MNLPKTDDKERTHKNDANTLSSHMINASMLHIWSMPRRKNQIGGRGLRTYFFFGKTPGMVLVFLVPLKISGKTKLHSWKFCKMIYATYLGNFKAKKKTLKSFTTRNLVKLCMLHLLEISSPKPKTPGNFTWIFLGLPWIFHGVFS